MPPFQNKSHTMPVNRGPMLIASASLRQLTVNAGLGLCSLSPNAPKGVARAITRLISLL
jgi:hypothetical protein